MISLFGIHIIQLVEDICIEITVPNIVNKHHDNAPFTQSCSFVFSPVYNLVAVDLLQYYSLSVLM